VSRSFKNISVVATATMVSRFLGLARDILVTAVFGTAALASAFYTAFTLPNLFRRLLGEGALTAAFVPTLNEELKAGQRAAAFRLVNTVASWLFVVSGSVVVCSMAAILLASRFTSGSGAAWIDRATAARWLEAADLAVFLCPYLVCVCLAAVFSGACRRCSDSSSPRFRPSG
jgi:putative peptidoglycan lipid II flippase